jgi:hypothetical protein
VRVLKGEKPFAVQDGRTEDMAHALSVSTVNSFLTMRKDVIFKSWNLVF